MKIKIFIFLMVVIISIGESLQAATPSVRLMFDQILSKVNGSPNSSIIDKIRIKFIKAGITYENVTNENPNLIPNKLIELLKSSKISDDEIIDIAKACKLNGATINYSYKYTGQIPNSFLYPKKNLPRVGMSSGNMFNHDPNTLYSVLIDTLGLLEQDTHSEAWLATTSILKQAAAKLGIINTGSSLK